jgi:hypothetical protein
MTYDKSIEMYHGILEVKDINSNESHEFKLDIPMTKVPGTSAGQETGATMTYCKRYLLMDAFNIADNRLDLDARTHTFDTDNPEKLKCAVCGVAITQVEFNFCAKPENRTKYGNKSLCKQHRLEIDNKEVKTQ